MSILATTPTVAASSLLVKSFRKQKSVEKGFWTDERSSLGGKLYRTNNVENLSSKKGVVLPLKPQEKRCFTCGLRCDNVTCRAFLFVFQLLSLSFIELQVYLYLMKKCIKPWRTMNFSLYRIYSNVNYFSLSLPVKAYLKTCIFLRFKKLKSSGNNKKIYV